MAAKHQYHAEILWQRRHDQTFTDQRYSRRHEWRFDGGTVVPASSSPLVVPPPMSVAAAVDPEEALVAALSSCHMLFFLAYAAQRGHIVEHYADHAVGTMGRNASGRQAMVEVLLRPRVTWGGGAPPNAEDIAELHERAHHDCYVANSVNFEVQVDPVC
jgi:organic hydroperoxide reductase OsmC/OhrA